MRGFMLQGNEHENWIGGKKKRTLRMPWRPIEQTNAFKAKYKERRPQKTFTPVSCHLSPDSSHSLSGSHLTVRHAARTWIVSREFETAPKRVMMVEAVLLYRCRMMEGGETMQETSKTSYRDHPKRAD